LRFRVLALTSSRLATMARQRCTAYRGKRRSTCLPAYAAVNRTLRLSSSSASPMMPVLSTSGPAALFTIAYTSRRCHGVLRSSRIHCTLLIPKHAHHQMRRKQRVRRQSLYSLRASAALSFGRCLSLTHANGSRLRISCGTRGSNLSTYATWHPRRRTYM